HSTMQVIRLILLLKKRRGPKGTKSGEGGLMVALWDGTGPSYRRDQWRTTGVTTGGLNPGVKEVAQPDGEWHAHVEAFLHKLSLTNARVKIHLSFKSYQKSLQRIFRPWVSVGERPWCQGGHQVTGECLSLSIPPEAMERGLYGELSLQPVALLAPCVLQYPNLVVVYSPSNVPVARPSDFLQQLPGHLDCEELGINGVLRCPPPTDLQHRGATTLTVGRETGGEADQGCSLALVEQRLTLFLFLQHTDPFVSELSDVLATEELLEHHLEAILNNNRQAVTAALQREMKNASEKMCSAFDVMLSSAVSIVSSSSNLEFRTACLTDMRVYDTHGLSLALREAQGRVTSWRSVPKSRCHSVQLQQCLGCDVVSARQHGQFGRIKSELETFYVDYDDDTEILDKMLEQAMCSRLQADELVLEWVAFSVTKNGLRLSIDTLDQFQHEVLNKKNKFRQSSKKEEQHNRTRDIHSLQDLIKAEQDEDNLLDSYSTPKGSQKRSLSTPEHPQSKRSAALLASPGLLLSPASFSPSATPSQKYSQRGAKGEVVVNFGSIEGSEWARGKGRGAGVRLELLEGPEDSLRCSYKFMFQRLRDVRNVLTEKIEELGEELRSHFNIEEFSPVALPAQDNITVLGQICCDSKGKLNAQSVVLEASPEHGGQQVPVDLSELKEYSLFPGQVVVMEGLNTTGRRLVASKLHQGLPLPFYTPEVKQEEDEVPEPVSVLVACGPYTPSDSLTFDPLLDLIMVIVRDRPDVCVLLGPFVDAKHEEIEKAQVTETYEAIFSRCVESIVEGTKSVGCGLVFVPSQRDIHHHFIYPQPPFTLPKLSKDQAPRVTLVPDPCTLLIEGVTLGLTSTDILFHMGAEEISSAAGSDRFSRILKHLLTQRSYYPLYPPVDDMNMDYEKFQTYGQMPLTPDLLVGQVGGTYSRLLIQRSSQSEGGERATPCLACQVVKI
ncbi:hypothetical protein NHX12_011110, partial [Muraenolepis orangiensis]